MGWLGSGAARYAGCFGRSRQKPSEMMGIAMSKVPIEVQIRTTNDGFGRFAALASGWLGSKWAFAGAGLIIVLWGLTGPLFHFSDTWQLVINTGTTIVTFLMVFLIQNTQNRDARAINLKLNELIRAIDKAGDQMIDIENLSDLELDELQAKYEKIKSECVERQGRSQKKAIVSNGNHDNT
jgi:low affinity Fe/Cu permease